MNILLTSAGRRSYIIDYFKRALNGAGNVHASNSVMSPALFHADEYTITPMIYDSDYIEYLKKYAYKNNIKAIIPLFDVDIPILSKEKINFKESGVQVVVSDYNVTQICNDKWKTHNFLEQNWFNVPKTYISIDTAKRDLAANTVQFPLVLKPRWGMGSIGIFIAESVTELEVLYNKTKYAVQSTYLSYESAIDIEHSVLIQQKINGQEYGVDVINDLNKNYVTTLVKRKIAMRAGETDVAITENNESIRDVGKRIAKSLMHIGNLDVDCFLADGIVYILELNCRLGGGYPFSHMAGANLPLALVKWLNEEEADSSLFTIEFGVEGYKEIIPKRVPVP
jgi:carbamoyl-phosphate synthase large subunit